MINKFNPLNHEEWLSERRKGIGGSDASAILGLNPWATPYTLWADKTGRLPDKPDNEAMRQGRDLEQYVAERFMEISNKKVRRKTQMLRNPDYPFAHANVDRWVVGENAGLECKTTSVMNLKRFKNGEFPETYYCQCVHYMAVTGAERWYLAVLILNQGFHCFTIERDQDEIDALMGAEQDFWKHVETDTPPPLDGLSATTDAIDRIYPSSRYSESPVALYGREKIIQGYLSIKDPIKALEREKEGYEQILKQDLQENESGECGCFMVNWKSQTRKTFDANAYVKDHPGLALDPYFKVTNFRKFEVKELK